MSRKANVSFRGYRKMLGIGSVLALATACGGLGDVDLAASPIDDDAAANIGHATSAPELAARDGCMRDGKSLPMEEAQISTAQGTRRVSFCRVTADTVLFDGDMAVSAADFANARVDRATAHRGLISKSLGTGRWPNGIVPFRIAASLPNHGRVTAAIREWEQKTSFRFVSQTNQVDYVEFVPFESDACWSKVGRVGGPQEIQLAYGCDAPSVMHEIGHAVGLLHEHSRSDRDHYIAVDTSCIVDGRAQYFSIASDSTNLGPYDYLSVMHYPEPAFAKPGCKTITSRTPGFEIGWRKELSLGDILSAHQLIFNSRPAVRPVPADYDGDGRADMSLKDDLGAWRIDFASGGFGTWDQKVATYTFADTIPVPADYDGDGSADLSVKSNDGFWFVDYSSNGFGDWDLHPGGYGFTNVIPVPADYDGDGRADFSVKSNDGVWLVDFMSNGLGWDMQPGGYGYTDVIPAPADYDGDGRADFSVKRNDGVWFVDLLANGLGWDMQPGGYGFGNVIPVPADYNGDGRADFAITGSDGGWLIDYVPGSGWDVRVYGHGGPGMTPVPADYDGDGKADISVKDRGGAGIWYVDFAADGFNGWNVMRVVGA